MFIGFARHPILGYNGQFCCYWSE